MAYSDTGFFGIYAGTDDNDAPELVQVVVDQLERAVTSITEAEVARAKAQMKASLLMALESSSARAEQIARQIMIYGRPLPTSEIVAKIEAVTADSTQEAGLALLRRSRLAIAGLGPGRGIERAAEIVENLARAAA
jgi:predicted Zn-dependent peptidase